MDTSTKNQYTKVTATKTAPKHNGRSRKSHVGEAASDLLNEGKKYANELYEEGLHKASEAGEQMFEYSDELLRKVQKHPLTSVLVAAGIGFLLSSILKK